MKNENFGTIKINLIWIIFLNQLMKVEAGFCVDCTEIRLDTESKNITFGPNLEKNCNCQWMIPTSMETDDNAAVVLLLQNVSLPIWSGSGKSTDCSARLRFPGTDGYQCSFANDYCLTFATESTICNINKINENIELSNHTCNSIKPWSESGGTPYKILYNAGNFAGYTKYFVIKYKVIDCRDETTTFEPKVTTQHEDSTKNYVAFSSITQRESTSTSQDRSTNQTSSSNSATITYEDQQQGSNASESSMNLTTIIIIAASGAGLLFVVLVAVILSIRFCKEKTESTEYLKQNEDETNTNPSQETVENSIYGATICDHKSETIINEIYDTTPVTEVSNDEPCLYAVVEKKTGDKKQDGDKNTGTEENIVIIEDESSSVYAVVNKEKKYY